MLRTRIARNCAEIEGLRTVWGYLHANSPSATLFQSYEANSLAARHFASRESPFVVLAESDAGAALIPAAIGRGGLTLLGETLFDYRDVLAVGDPNVLRAAWRKLAQVQAPMSVTALRGDETRNRWAVLCPTPFVTAGQVLRGETSASESEQRHGGLRRALRRLLREGFGVRQYSGSDTGLVSWIYGQKAQQIDGPESVFRDSARREFMVSLCRVEGLHCEVFALKSETAVAAVLVTFRDRQVRRFYTIWFDSRWAKYSPGTALLFEVTRRSLAEGLDCDYMTGEQPHKLRFQTSRVPLYRVNAAAILLEAAAGSIRENLLTVHAEPVGREPGTISSDNAAPAATARSRAS